GHEQYTRNMATGASNCDLAVILIDARKGVLTQTRRHSYICSMMGIRHVVVAVNKIDLVDYSEERFQQIVESYLGFAASLGFGSITAIPMSARYGDNVTSRSERMRWYEGPMLPGRSYLMRIGTKYVPARVTRLKHRVDVNSLEHIAARTLELNEVGVCNVATATPVAFDAYAENRETGAFILIDRFTHATAGAGMISFGLRRATNVHRQSLLIDKAARERLNGHKAVILWFTGLSGSGKSTIANIVERELHARGAHTYLLDGDNVRHGLN